MIVIQNGVFKRRKQEPGFFEGPKTEHDFYVISQTYPEGEFVVEGYFLKKYNNFSKKELNSYNSLKKIEQLEEKRW